MGTLYIAAMARDNRPRTGRKRRRGGQSAGAGYWMWGHHTVLAAIRNPRREIRRILAARATIDTVAAAVADAGTDRPAPEGLEPGLIPADAVHQGWAAEVVPLPEPDPTLLAAGGRAAVVVLDQVSDPHNVGAILRTCAVLGARALVTPKDNMPGETGVVAKAASGALEAVPVFRVTNLVRSIESLKQDGYFVIGLDATGDAAIADHLPVPRGVLVAGAEGRGLRRLVREHCDVLASLPVADAARAAGIDSLNVSAAVAVGLHELVRRK